MTVSEDELLSKNNRDLSRSPGTDRVFLEKHRKPRGQEPEDLPQKPHDLSRAVGLASDWRPGTSWLATYLAMASESPTGTTGFGPCFFLPRIFVGSSFFDPRPLASWN